jgi:hypothetical protein
MGERMPHDPNGPDEVRYRIDADDRLVRLGAAWDRFARANGAPELARGRVRGRGLWEFITSIEARHLHKRLLEAVRAGRAIRALPFRCDSPDTRRFMEMDLLPRANGAVEYRCRLVRAERREAVALVMAAAGGTGALVKMCSWCKRVEVTPGAWRDVEAAVRELGLLEQDPTPGVTHGLCPDCRTRYYPEVPSA